MEEAKEEVEENLRGLFLEDLRSRPDLEPREIVRRADRLGCDLLAAGVLCAELTSDRPRHVVATISGDEPGALAQHIPDANATHPARGRVYALIPAVGGDNAPEATLERARRLARRLGQHGTVGLSSFYTDPASSRARSRRPSWSSRSCASPRAQAATISRRTSARAPTACCSACWPAP